jgi:hypothetical protein
MVFLFLRHRGILIYCASSATEYPREGPSPIHADPLPVAAAVAVTAARLRLMLPRPLKQSSAWIGVGIVHVSGSKTEIGLQTEPLVAHIRPSFG